MSDQLTSSLYARSTRSSGLDVEIRGDVMQVETSANVSVDNTFTPWLPPLRVTAMGQGLDVHVPGAVDSHALDGSVLAQDLLLEWFPDELHSVTVTAEDRDPARDTSRMDRDRGVACFFSGGVDSFYSTIKHSSEITHLIVIHGLDITLDNARLWNETAGHIRQVSEQLGMELIEVRTNLRHLHAKFGPHWQKHAHGALLAHVALLLSPHVRKVIIPASDFEERLEPLGTHPDLDPLWSSGTVELVHDGIEADRVDKLDVLKDNPVAMQHLRVCWSNLSGKYNCGRCEKCVRTMIGLRIVGALEACETLPHNISIPRVRRLFLNAAGEGGELFARDNLDSMRVRGVDDSELEKALEYALHRGSVANALIKARFYLVDVYGAFARYKLRQLLR